MHRHWLVPTAGCRSIVAATETALQRSVVRLSAWAATAFAVRPRLTVMAVALLAGGDLLAACRYPPGWLLPLIVAGCAIGALARRPAAALTFSLLPVLMYFYGTAVILHGENVGVLPLAKSRYASVGGVVLMVQGKGENVRLLVRPSTVDRAVVEMTGWRLLVELPRAASPTDASVGARFEPGDEIVLRGRLIVPEFARWPWDFDEQGFVHRHGASLLLRLSAARDIRLLKRNRMAIVQTSQKMLDDTRSRMVMQHESVLGTVRGALLSSMVIGDRAVDVPSAMAKAFRDVGLSHILAASGFNLTVVSAVVWWLARLATRNALVVNGLVFVSIMLFVGLAGASPSVGRAAIMCCVVLAARCIYRSPYLPATLACALAATIVVDPSSVLDVGLQLSYFATAGIVCFAQAFSKNVSERLPRAPGWLVEGLSLALIAQLSVLPIQLWYFWQIGMFFLLANVLVSPLVPLITILGFASSALAAVPSVPTVLVCSALDFLNQYPLIALQAVVEHLAALSWSRFTTGPPLAAALLFYYLAFASLGVPCGKFRPAFASVFALAVLLLFFRKPMPELTVVCNNHAVLIVNAKHEAVLLGNGCTSLERACAYFGAHVVQSLPELRSASLLDNDVLAVDVAGKCWQIDIRALRLEQRVAPRSSIVLSHQSGSTYLEVLTSFSSSAVYKKLYCTSR